MNRIAEVNAAGKSEIKVSGHTDDVPLIFGSNYRDNWDLAAARSASVVQAFAPMALFLKSALRLSAMESHVRLNRMTPLTDAQKIDGSKSKSTINSLLDAFSRKCMAIGVQHKLNSTDVVGATTDLFTSRGLPASIHLRLRNGPEFVALRFQDWLKKVGSATADLSMQPMGEWI